MASCCMYTQHKIDAVLNLKHSLMQDEVNPFTTCHVHAPHIQDILVACGHKCQCQFVEHKAHVQTKQENTSSIGVAAAPTFLYAL